MLTRTTLMALAASLMAFAAADAQAEDDYMYNMPNAQQPIQQYQVLPNDQQYQLPMNYHGRYYPQENEGHIGYYGTERSTDARQDHNSRDAQQPYYYYYY